MNILILALVLLVVSVVAVAISDKTYHDGLLTLSVGVSVGTAIFIFVYLFIFTLLPPERIALFTRQKAYIESLSPDALENAGAIIVKAEQNEWLFRAQYVRERYGDWGIYPESVLELEPIE